MSGLHAVQCNVGKRVKVPPKRTVFALLVLLCVFSIHLLHHLSLYTERFTFVWDGQSYLESCNSATQILMALCGGNSDQATQLASNPDFVKRIVNDGPVQTILFGLVFTLIGHPPTTFDWQIFVVATALCQSVSAMLLYLLCLEITGEWVWSLCLGLAYGLNPSVIVACGRLGTEPWFVLCILSFVYFLTGDQSFKKFVSGFFAGLAILLKAVLIPGIAAALLFATVPFKKESVRNLMIVLSGLALAIAPWFLYTNATTGRGLLYTPRMAAYNAAVRLDVESDAWCTIPESQFVASKFEKDDTNTEILDTAGIFGDDASAQFGILVRKIGRLMSHPWNDFRFPVLGFIDIKLQDILHKCILFLTILGIALCFTRGRWNLFNQVPSAGSAEPPQYLRSFNGRLILKLSLILLAGHFFYLLFQSIGRYFFMAYPFAMLFALLGLRSSLRFLQHMKSQLKDRVKLGASGAALLIASGGICWFICVAENIDLPWVGFESATVIQPGQSLETTFDFSGLKELPKADAVLALIDADGACEQSAVYLNEKKLDSRICPISRFSADLYEQSKQLRIHSTLLRMPQSKLRQWRAVRIPVSLINLNEPNVLSLKNNAKVPFTVYGACKNQAYIPSPGLYASDYMLNSAESLDLRLPQRLLVDGVLRASCDSPYGIIFVFDNIPTRTCRLETASKLPLGRPSFPMFSKEFGLFDFPGEAISLNQTLRVNAHNATTPDALTATMLIPLSPNVSHETVILTGRIRLEGGKGKVGVKLVVQKRNGESFMSYSCPDYISAEKDNWKDFAIADCIPMSFLAGGIRAVSVTLSPMPISQAQYGPASAIADAQIKDLRVTVIPFNSLDVTGK